MDSTNHPHPLPSPDRHPRWAKFTETSLLIVLAVAICLIAALGLVAIGIFAVLFYGMSNYGSNK